MARPPGGFRVLKWPQLFHNWLIKMVMVFAYWSKPERIASGSSESFAKPTWLSPISPSIPHATKAANIEMITTSKSTAPESITSQHSCPCSRVWLRQEEFPSILTWEPLHKMDPRHARLTAVQCPFFCACATAWVATVVLPDDVLGHRFRWSWPFW